MTPYLASAGALPEFRWATENSDVTPLPPALDFRYHCHPDWNPGRMTVADGTELFIPFG